MFASLAGCLTILFAGVPHTAAFVGPPIQQSPPPPHYQLHLLARNYTNCTSIGGGKPWHGYGWDDGNDLNPVNWRSWTLDDGSASAFEFQAFRPLPDGEVGLWGEMNNDTAKMALFSQNVLLASTSLSVSLSTWMAGHN